MFVVIVFSETPTTAFVFLTLKITHPGYVLRTASSTHEGKLNLKIIFI